MPKRVHVSSLLRPIEHWELLSRIWYNPSTGNFFWRDAGPRSLSLDGREAGYVNKEGYRVIAINGCRYMGHNLAWFYVYGVWPKDTIDHKNGERDNNQIDNLREATRAQQTHNQKLKSSNTTGYKGVTFNKREGKYKAKIYGGNDGVHLGYFADPVSAALAYDDAARKEFGEYAALNSPCGVP